MVWGVLTAVACGVAISALVLFAFWFAPYLVGGGVWRVGSGGEGEGVGAVLGNAGGEVWLLVVLAVGCLGGFTFVAGRLEFGFVAATWVVEPGESARPEPGTVVIAVVSPDQNPGPGLLPVSLFESAMVVWGAGEDSRCEW